MNLGSSPPQILGEASKAFSAFMSALREGRRPRIEDVLEDTVQSDRSIVLRLLIVKELAARISRGETPSMDEYLARFPVDPEAVRDAFADTEEESASTDPDPRLAEPTGTPLPSTIDALDAGSSELTVSFTYHHGEKPLEANAPMPEMIGRFRPTRFLGEGGFGRVYHAWDDQLNRAVAVKVARAGIAGGRTRRDNLLHEARMAAQLDHPAIVTLFEVGWTGAGEPFVVLKYVEGPTLAGLLRKKPRLTVERLCAILARVADAAHHAHKNDIVHRDLTPANILIDAEGAPHVTDFGLALNEDLQRARQGEVAGKTGYMAPEQVRGETNHFDGRTDVWALGVILYQGLTGRFPFTGATRAEVFDAILERDPKPPRQLDERVPAELERICLRCLAKRKTDRYNSAVELAEDLRAWLARAAPAPEARIATPSVVVPRGLRAFEKGDAEFFLDLLPGPRDRHGVPDSIRFWRSRLGASDGSAPGFGVGLLYGPSGGGKTSFARAGLLPMLGVGVRAVVVEATPDRAEAGLLSALRGEFPELPEDLGLVETAALLRDDPRVRGGNKALIVLDQFEQWLHAHPSDPSAELVRALRHCDGQGLQALVLARDDFWMAVTRFFRALETPLIEGENMAAVELFDAEHARAVLLKFGRAYGRLPADPEPPGPAARAFLDEAIADVAGAEGRVAPVRLSLFAEVARRRPWTPATLRALGGVDGIGVTFLEEAFGLGSTSAPPPYRAHRKAIIRVLEALLPEASSNLKGRTRPVSALQQTAGLADRPGEFAEVLRILDTELKLITPVDTSAGSEIEEQAAPKPEERGYQLTHDFLVPALRDWLTSKERETRQGRARLRLAAAASFWREKPEPRRLPSVLEWLFLVRNTRRSRRSPDEGAMLRAAGRRYLARAAIGFVLLTLAGFTVVEVRQRDRASALLAQALHADARKLPELLPELAANHARIREPLAFIERDAPRNSPNGSGLDPERARLILFHQEPTPERARALIAQLRTAEPDDLALVREALAAHPALADAPGLHEAVLDDNDDASAPGARLASALARIAPERVADWGPAADALTRALLAEDRRTVARWLELLEPAGPLFARTLRALCDDPARDPATRANAAEAFAVVLVRQGDNAALAQAVLAARAEASRPLLRALRQVKGGAVGTLLREQLDERADDLDNAGRDRLADRQAAAAVALAALGSPEVLWPRLRHRDDPRLRTRLILSLAATDDASRWVLARLDRPIAELDPIERQALLMILAETDHEALPANVREQAAQRARTLYADDPDAAVHAAAALLLKRWGRDDLLATADAALLRAKIDAPPNRSWIVGPNGHTLAVARGPLAFWIGSPGTELERYGCEERQYRKIDRSIAVSTTPVTVAQFRAFKPDYRPEDRYAHEPDCPAINITWYAAAAYCNWLNIQERVPEDQWCYPREVKDSVRIEGRAIEKTGYRLPTEAEWEYLCRAGCVTSRPFDESDAFLSRHAWTWRNSLDRAHPVARLLPNELGLFDMLGNVWQWCQDGPADVSTGAYQDPYPKGTLDAPASDVVPDLPNLNPDTWRYLRGGGFDFSPNKARSAFRDEGDVGQNRPFIGFRVVRTLRAESR